MHEDLIERLREDKSWIEQGTTETEHEIAEHIQQAADAIEQLSNAGSAYGRGWTLGYDAGREESKPRWIPVTERLPEMYETVLVVNDDGMCQTAERTESFDTKDGWAIHYCVYDADAWDEDENGVITHWMPLPKRPKEEA